MKQTPRATTTDGRNIDLGIAMLQGEAAGIASARPEATASLGAGTLALMATKAGASTTYYEQPVLKAPVWKAWIPTYFFVGGLAGGAAAIGAAAQLVGGARTRSIVMPARWIAAGGVAVSAGLLIADLGRPARFLNMLRVFRPTSPMNVGTWILTGAGATSAAAAVLPRIGARRLADVAGASAGVFGLGLASYTAVLLASTAVPAWQYGRRSLPPLFVASAAVSTAAALELLPRAVARASRTLDLFGGVAKLAELAAGFAYERELAMKGDVVVRHATKGRAGLLLRASQVLTASSLALSLFGRGSRAARRTSGALGLGGGLALRFAVMDAGRSSAMDPRATFEPQRRDQVAQVRS